MAALPPLQLLIFRHPDDGDVAAYEEALLHAFQGGKEAGGYLATGEDLGIQLRVFATTPSTAPGVTLDEFSHSLVIVFADNALLQRGGDAVWDWLAACWQLVDASNGRHTMLPIPMDERTRDAFTAKRPALGSLQGKPVQDYGERAVRPALAALHVLHEARVLLARAVPLGAGAAPPGHLRLFISHAKIDGLPLAQALKHLIQSIPWLSTFYDAEDLPPGSNWQRELEAGVGTSLIIMLRTEVYDSRHWCQQEVRWADEYATPAVLVEARTGLNHVGGFLPFDRVPTVRIPDGNLMRVLFVALREGLRYLHFQRRVMAMRAAGELPDPVELRAFSYAPSMSALLRACQSISAAARPADVPRVILYPDPVLPSGTFEAARALIHAYEPNARLTTPNTIAAVTPP